MLAVVLSIISSFALIILGSWNILDAVIFYNPLFDDSMSSYNDLLFKIISAIDLFLIGIVLLILSVIFMLIYFVFLGLLVAAEG